MVRNIKRLTLLLSKSLLFVFMLFPLVGMFNPANPPGPDLYIQTRNRLIVDYNNTNGNTNQRLHNYNIELLNFFNFMRDGAQQAFLWAQHHRLLAKIDASRARLIHDRISSIAGAINRFAANAKSRAEAVQANVPGAVALPDDQNILNALNTVNNIIMPQAQDAVGQVQHADNQAQISEQNANARHNAIVQIINQMNQPILGVGYVMQDIQNYRTLLANVLTEFNQANRFACTARDYAVQVHNQVNLLNQLIQNIGQEGININLQLPPF